MWPFSEPSLELASRISDVANAALLISLIVGLVSTYLIVSMGNKKEEYWEIDRAASRERIAQLNNETAHLRAKEFLVDEALLANARTGDLNAIASNAGFVANELLAFRQGAIDQEDLSEAARALLIIPKLEPFAGKQFDAIVTSGDLGLVTFFNSLRHTLKKAGWIEVSPVRPTNQEQSNGGGSVFVSIHVDRTELLDAANALASALKTEGIAAAVDPKTDNDAVMVSVIHVLVGPRTPR